MALVLSMWRSATDAWWLQDISPWPFGWLWPGPWPAETMRRRVLAGPPRG